MKSIIMVVLIIVLVSGLCFAVEQTVLSEEKDRFSYSVGYQMGGDFKQQSMDLDPDAFLKGVEDAFAEAEPQLSAEEMRATLLELKKKIVAMQKAKKADQRIERKNMKEKYWGEGREFLAENAKKDGVITLPSGLQYKVINEGNGRIPGPNDSVTVHYRGTLIDGTEFGSSYHDNKPGEFRVDGVIKGWTEALQLMKEGAKWQLFIPADLAYRERGPLADKTVIFDIELISVKPFE